MSPSAVDRTLAFARAKAYHSDDPSWWANLAAVYATLDPPRVSLARRWYRKAAAKRNPRAMFELGLMLIQGEGGRTRPAYGRRLAERAAAAGEVDAMKVLCEARGGVLGFALSPARARQAARDYGEMRTIRVQRGARRHEVLLSDLGNPSDSTQRRAAAVWKALRSILRTDEQLDADPMER